MEQNYDSIVGLQSLKFLHPVYVQAAASIVGKKEGEGPLGEKFDVVCSDDKFGEDTWELSESALQNLFSVARSFLASPI